MTRNLSKATRPLFLAALLLVGPTVFADGPVAPISYSYEVVTSYPHDPDSFTQGLEFEKGQLYEGTGQYAESRLLQVDLATGKILREHKLDVEFFGEGITILGDRVYQLTWQNKKGFVYDLATFKELRDFTYKMEGWGLTNDGKELIMSDGSSWLYFLDPETLKVTRQIEVVDRGRPIKNLNELEWVGGSVLANIWMTNELVQIDPGSGKVISQVDLTGLLPAAEHTDHTDVLNGIAWDEAAAKLYVTGKYWPKLYEIKLVPAKK